MQTIQKVLEREQEQDLASAYLKVKRSKGLKKETLISYKQGLDIFENWRTQPYDKLNQGSMADYINHLNSIGGTSATRKLRLHVVKGFLRWVLSGNIVSGRLKGPLPEVVAYLEIKKILK